MSNTTPVAELPAWPREFGRGETINEWKAAEYERKRAAYWEARCRLAVECMTDVQRILVDKDIAHRESVGMYNVLCRIGPLPPLPPKEGA